MRSIYDNVIVAGVCGPTFQTGTSVTTTGAYVDTKGFNTGAMRVVATPVGSTLSPSQGSTLVATLLESNTTTGFTTALDNTGTPIGFTIAVSTAAVASTTAVLQNGVYIGNARIEGLGLNRKRYLQLQVVGLAVAGGLAASAFTTFGVIELGRGYVLPTDLTPGGAVPVSNT